MPRRSPTVVIIIGFLIGAATLSLAPRCASAGLRNTEVGDALIGFELKTHTGETFKYDPAGGRVIAVVFMPSMDKQFETTISAMAKVLDQLSAERKTFDFVGVVTGQSALKLVEASDKADITFPIVVDSQYKLWGKLGVIATPTTLVAGADGKIQWIQAGYGYDFIPALEGRITQALGLEVKQDPDEHIKVKVVDNSTPEARVNRHIQMARMLEKKGRIDAAVAELTKAAELDPNSMDANLELGQLLCRIDRPDDALRAAAAVKATRSVHKAGVMLIAGWANRLKGKLDEAEKFLTGAAKLDSKNARTHFELGKLYQADGRPEQALKAYHTALAILFDEKEGPKTSQKREG